MIFQEKATKELREHNTLRESAILESNEALLWEIRSKDKNGKTILIKANYSYKTIGIRGEADLLLVIKVKVDGTWEELYFGDFKKAREIANFSARDNKHSISITALKNLVTCSN